MRQITKPTCCIVHFKEPEGVPSYALPRRIHYQVTIDPAKFSAGGFVRFGDAQGDEITGWQPQDLIVIDEILGQVQEDGVTVVREAA